PQPPRFRIDARPPRPRRLMPKQPTWRALTCVTLRAKLSRWLARTFRASPRPGEPRATLSRGHPRREAARLRLDRARPRSGPPLQRRLGDGLVDGLVTDHEGDRLARRDREGLRRLHRATKGALRRAVHGD